MDRGFGGGKVVLVSAAAQELGQLWQLCGWVRVLHIRGTRAMMMRKRSDSPIH